MPDVKTCLIIDDSHVVRKVIGRVMQNFGFEYTEADNGHNALDACKETMPDAILLDWNMPVMSGVEFLETLRAIENGKKPKVVFCTTENNVDQIQRALDEGADEFIMKPFDNEIIQSKFIHVGLLDPL